MSRKKSKKAVPALKIPPSFFIGEDLWRVEYRWNLTIDGHKGDGFIHHDSRTILMDKLIPVEEKSAIFLRLFMWAVISYKIVPGQATDIVSEDLMKAVLQNFKLRWKRSNDK